jgi:hypothetical protein
MRRTFLIVCAAAILLIISMLGNASVHYAQGDQTPTPTSAESACGRLVANTFTLLKSKHNFSAQAQPGSADYCASLETEMNVFIEAMFKPQPGIAGVAKDAYAFVDYAARQYVGVMPAGTTFQAVARNSLPGSQMILVIGDNFEVFLDYVYTSLTQAEFETLPDYRDYQGTIKGHCDASWCRNPAPPPTSAK